LVCCMLSLHGSTGRLSSNLDRIVSPFGGLLLDFVSEFARLNLVTSRVHVMYCKKGGSPQPIGAKPMTARARLGISSPLPLTKISAASSSYSRQERTRTFSLPHPLTRDRTKDCYYSSTYITTPEAYLRNSALSIRFVGFPIFTSQS